MVVSPASPAALGGLQPRLRSRRALRLIPRVFGDTDVGNLSERNIGQRQLHAGRGGPQRHVGSLGLSDRHGGAVVEFADHGT